MQTNRTVFMLVPAIIIAAAIPAAAQTAPAADAPPRTSIHGFASFGYSFRFDTPEGGANEFRVFDLSPRHFRLDGAEVVVQRTAGKPGEFGYRADLVTGASIPRVSAASGLFRDSVTGVVTPADLDLQQAYMSYVLPVGSGLHVDAGKFTTHVGAEVIEGFDGYGDTYSRGLLFGFAEPFTHTGVRVSYSLTGSVSAMVLVVNGWDNVRDNNGTKSIGAQVALQPSKRASVFVNYIGGAERADSGDRRDLFDVVSVISPRPGVTVTLSSDIGREAGAAAGGVAVWRGASSSVKVDLTAVAGIAARAEWFSDPSGARTGTVQSLSGLTVAPFLKAGDHTVLRGEFRADRSSAPVFSGVSGARTRQLTTAFNAVVVF